MNALSLSTLLSTIPKIASRTSLSESNAHAKASVTKFDLPPHQHYINTSCLGMDSAQDCSGFPSFQWLVHES